MTKEKLWLLYIEKYPSLADKNNQVRLTGTGLRQLFELTYEHGYKEGYSSKSKENSLFENIFGKVK